MGGSWNSLFAYREETNHEQARGGGALERGWESRGDEIDQSFSSLKKMFVSIVHRHSSLVTNVSRLLSGMSLGASLDDRDMT